MHPFNLRLNGALFLLFSIGLCNFCIAQNARQDVAKVAKQSAGDSKSRGQYIVENLAVCSQCHTPHNEAGIADRSHWLEGAAVWLKPAEPNGNWPLQAPRIAGMPPGTDAEMITLLTTGIWKDGKYLRPPMPQFRMTQPDAEAVLTYLKSLNGEPSTASIKALP